MTKHTYLLFALLVVLCSGGFVNATEPPSYLLFRSDAQQRLDSLNTIPSSENARERLLLAHNLVFHKTPGMSEYAQDLLSEYFEKSDDPVVVGYKGSLKMMRARDRGLGGNLWKMGSTMFGLFGDSPAEEAYKGFADIQKAAAADTGSIQLRLLYLNAAVESAEHLDGLLGHASACLKWFRERTERLDSAETMFYALSWAKYAYKYTLKYEMASELPKGQSWLTYAERFAITEEYCEEIYIWWIKLDSLHTEMTAGSE